MRAGAPSVLKIDALRRRVDLDPRNSEFYQNPYPAYAAIRAAAPVFYWEQYGFWCFANHADVSQILRDKRFGRQILHVASRAELGWPEDPKHLAEFHAIERHSLLELEPPAHTRLRQLVNRAFVSRHVERLTPRIAELAHRLIDEFASSGNVELLNAFATPIPVIVIAELLGAPTSKWRDLLQWSHAMVAMYQFGVTREVEDGAVAAARAFGAFLRDLIKARRRAPSDDLISKLIEAHAEQGALSEAELISTCVLLLNAGHEATVHALGNGVKALLESPQSIKALAPAECPALVEEILRFDAPLHMFTRYALEDVALDGLRLRRGERIGLLLGAANRDPARFADADVFDPARNANAHVSLGAGIHFCLGAPLARLELQIALPILFQRLPGLALAAPLEWRDSYHFHGLKRLDVTWRA